MRRMSMWYDFDEVLILKYSVCPTVTLVDVAKPWIIGSPAPLTRQSLGGSPGKEFWQAITFTTGGPHGLAAAAGRTLTKRARPRITASPRLMIVRRAEARCSTRPVTDMSVPPRAMSPYFLFITGRRAGG